MENNDIVGNAHTRMQEALGKIQELRNLRLRLGNDPSSWRGMSEKNVRRVMDMMLDLERRADSVLSMGVRTFNATRMSQRVDSNDDKKQGMQLGTLIGKLGHAVVKGPQTILRGAVPITHNILKSSADFVSTTVQAANGAAQTIAKSTADVAGNLVDAARNTSNTLISQTANAASSITKTATDSISRICGRGTNEASTKISETLGQHVDNMVSNVSGLASQIINGATNRAGTLIANVQDKLTGASSGLKGITSAAVNGMGNTVSNFASSLIGADNANAMTQNFPQSVGKVETTPSTNLGANSLFGSALTTAQTAGQGVKTALSNLVGGLSSGLGGLASSMFGTQESGGILSGAASIAQQIASTGLDAANEIFGAATDVGNSLLSGAGETAKSILNTAGDVGGSLLDTVADLAADAASSSSDSDLAQGFMDFADDALGAGMDLAGAVMDTAGDIVGNLMDTASDMAQSVVDGVSDIVDGLFSDSIDGVEDIADELYGDFDDIADEAGELEDEWDEDGWEDDYLDEDGDGDVDDSEGDEEDSDEDEEDEEDWYDDYEEEGWDDEYDDEDEDDGENEDVGENDGDSDESDSSEESDIQTPEDLNQPQYDKRITQDQSTNVPMGSNNSLDDVTLETVSSDNNKFGWKSEKVTVPKDLVMMMHDGDQQLLNPYGHKTANWTMYSFRPQDTSRRSKTDENGNSVPDEPYPQIAITPSSFEAIRSMDTMLDNIPYIVVKEYFFKNTASTMVDFVKKIMGVAYESFDSAGKQSNENDVSTQGSQDAKQTGGKLLDKIKQTFVGVSLKEMAIDIPYLLYTGLRQKLYGNTYIFPYLVEQTTAINQASNHSEWNNDSDNKGNFMNMLKNSINGIANFIGGVATSMMGSQSKPANLFPAPTWSGPAGDKIGFKFNLVLINDHVIKARNNYMCVNTIIHNNRSIQKAILAFPGALYEVWLPTGQRHLMCTGSFTLFPLGLNRKVPKGFFSGGGVPGADFSIGQDNDHIAPIQNPEKSGHRDDVEVIPDAYNLEIEFKSCLANNMNTSVFQYYVKMAEYNNGGVNSQPPGASSRDDISNRAVDVIMGLKGNPIQEHSKPEPDAEPANGQSGGQTSPSANANQAPASRSRDFLEDAIQELVQDAEEKFDESTYNKRLQKMRADMGDQNVTSESAVVAIRRAQRVIGDTKRFLGKLYGAESNNLWYRPFGKEELYTTMKPDYRQVLKKKYGETLDKIVKTDSEIERTRNRLQSIQQRLVDVMHVRDRVPIVEKRTKISQHLNSLMKQRMAQVDEILQIDVDMIQSAFDEHDYVVSVGKRAVTLDILQQTWNENIMNTYEREKIQYLTSKERERYFNDKIRELRKYDEHGILTHRDWFFRIVVLDYIVQEMQRLILWFKNCSWDDFETVYRITRKLGLLQLDVESVYSDVEFDINRTNMFYISGEDVERFKKIDSLLCGNTLYELFNSQLRITAATVASESPATEDSTPTNPPPLVQEQKTEMETAIHRRVRQDVVARVWGNEVELTRAAYKEAADCTDNITLDIPGCEDITTMEALKNEILRLKLSGDNADKLKTLLGAFSNQVFIVKENMVLVAMQDMGVRFDNESDYKDESTRYVENDGQ